MSLDPGEPKPMTSPSKRRASNGHEKASRARKYKSFHAFRMTPEEKEELVQFAEAEGLSVSDALRLCALSHQGLTRLEYGDFGAEVERGKKWRVTRGRHEVASGLSRKEAISRAQRYHADLAGR